MRDDFNKCSAFGSKDYALTQVPDADSGEDLLVDPEDVPPVEPVGAAGAGKVADVGGLQERHKRSQCLIILLVIFLFVDHLMVFGDLINYFIDFLDLFQY